MTATPRRVGIGLDAQYADAYPYGMAGLCERLRDRLSHVSIVSLRSVQHARSFREDCAGTLPVIHHLSSVAPAAAAGPDLARYATLDAISVELGAKWSCEDIGEWSLGPFALPYFAPPLLSAEAADHTTAGVRELVRRGSVPFLAEIPSFTIAAGELHVGEFFRRLAGNSGCGLVADVSHMFSYSVCAACTPGEVIEQFPLEHVVEIHIAGGRVDAHQPDRYIDSHSDPIMEPVLEILAEVVCRARRLRAVTFEIGVGLTYAQIADDLERVQRVLEAVGWTPTIAVEAS